MSRSCGHRVEKYEEDGDVRHDFGDDFSPRSPMGTTNAPATGAGGEALEFSEKDQVNPIRKSFVEAFRSRTGSKLFERQVSGNVAKEFPTMAEGEPEPAAGESTNPVGRLIARGFSSIVGAFRTTEDRSRATKEQQQNDAAKKVTIKTSSGQGVHDPKDQCVFSADEAGAAAATMGATNTQMNLRDSETGDSKDPKWLLQDIERRISSALQIMIENPKDISSCYIIEQKELGKGAFGSVKRAKVRATGAVRAIKFVLKARMKGKDFFLKNEIELLKCVDHPNVIKLYELFEDDEQLYMVMELCSGGCLLDHVHRVGRFTEPQAAKSMLQLLRAVYYLHLQMIVHRDIKPANCLFASRDTVERSSLRLTDFGLSCRFTADKMMTERVGTTAFMSPQVINRKYDYRCDIWSCGVVMYMLLCGWTPFSAKTEDEVRARVTSGSYTFDPNIWLDVSEDAMMLIRRLLKVNPAQRATMLDALQSEWLRKKVAEANCGYELDYTILRNLRGFRSLNKFKRSALCVIASFLDEEQTRDARETFCALDNDDDGMLDHLELRERLSTLELSLSDDGESSGRNKFVRSVSEENFCARDPEPYSYTEFLAATFDRKLYCQRGVCWAAFNALDTNGDGYLQVQELATGNVLGDLSEGEVLRLVQDFDKDGDGSIDFQEFMEMMRDGEGWTPTMRSPRSSGMSSPRRGSGRNTPKTMRRNNSNLSMGSAVSMGSRERQVVERGAADLGGFLGGGQSPRGGPPASPRSLQSGPGSPIAARRNSAGNPPPASKAGVKRASVQEGVKTGTKKVGDNMVAGASLESAASTRGGDLMASQKSAAMRVASISTVTEKERQAAMARVSSLPGVLEKPKEPPPKPRGMLSALRRNVP